MELLRINTAGSVDDGKSTLIGRLLHETRSISDDKMQAIELASRRRGLNFVDLSLLTDGLVAEREQGITIDVAHIYFSTGSRRYIIADTPGHVEYTRNMVTGASNAEVSIILIDVRNQVVEQTLRHLYISSLLGIKRIIIAVNKMDLVDYDQNSFAEVSKQVEQHLDTLKLDNVSFDILPISSLEGVNITSSSTKTPWYQGPPLLDILEGISPNSADEDSSIFQVQQAIRPRTEKFPDFRGYAGKNHGGTLSLGQEVTTYPSLKTTRISSINQHRTQIEEAHTGQSVVVCLEEDIDLRRGDYLLGTYDPSKVSRNLVARLCWMSETPLNPHQKYILQLGSMDVQAKVTDLVSSTDMTTLKESSSTEIGLNDVSRVHIKTSQPIYCMPFNEQRHLGAFIFVDPMTKSTVAVGFIEKSS
jgi:sulfate adenylyltransferase subunit 1